MDDDDDVDVKLALRHAPPFALCEENLSSHDFPLLYKVYCRLDRQPTFWQ